MQESDVILEGCGAIVHCPAKGYTLVDFHIVYHEVEIILLKEENKMVHNILSKLQKLFDKPIIVVGAITILGALLRFYHLGFKPLWVDEATLYWISHGNLQNIIAQNASQNSAPPLFAILISPILKIGDSETILRSLSWVGGVAAIPAIYFLSRQFLNRNPAYFTTLVVAIAPTQVKYSQELREYSLTFLVAIIILLFFFKHLRRPNWYNWSFMTLAMMIGIFLQYGLALLIIALNLVCVVELLSNKANRKDLLLRWSVAQVVCLCAVVAIYSLSLRQQMRVGFGATSTISYLSRGYWDGGSLRSLLSLAITNTLNIFDFTVPGGYFTYFIVGVGFISVLQDRNRYIALMMFVFPVILTFIVASARLYPYLGARQDMFLTPMIYLLVGFGFDSLLKVIQQRWIILLLLLFTFFIGFKPTLDYLKSTGDEIMKPVANALSKDFEKGDKIYVYFAAKPGFTYYYRNNLDSQIYGTSNRGNPSGYFQEIDKLLSSNSRFWMVFSHCDSNDCDLIKKYVSDKRKFDLVVSGNDAYDGWLYLVH